MTFCSLAMSAIFFMDTKFSGLPSGMTDLVAFLCSVYLVVAGIFLAWGPATMARLSVHIVLLGISGFYGVLTNKYEVKLFFVVFGAFVTLLLFGSGFIFTGITGGMSFIDITETGCKTFFGSNADRCADDGYLMFLRIIGTIAIFVLIAGIVCLLPAVATDASSGSSNNKAAAPAAAPASATVPADHA